MRPFLPRKNMNKIEEFISQLVVLDTETTGVDENADIIEVSLSFPVDSDEPISEIMNYTQRYKPLSPVPPEASAIHSITTEDLADCPSYVDDIDSINELLLTRRFYVGHNVTFDRTKLIENHARSGSPLPEEIADENSWICTLRFARKMFAEDMDYANFTLSYLWFKYELYKKCDYRIKAHSAEDDVYMCYKVLLHLVQLAIEQGHIDPNQDIGQQIVDFCNAPFEYKIMPIGKHKGVPMNELVMDYMTWMVEKSDILNEKHPTFNRDLAYTFEQEFGRRLGL